MADDAAGLLDALGIPSAHVLGVSMGGMIAQSFAIQHPERVRTLVSIMSTTGDPSSAAPSGGARGVARPPAHRPGGRDRPVREDVGRDRLARIPAARGADPGQGGARPTTGPFTRRARPARWSPSWPRPTGHPGLAKVEVPTLVIHGESDPLVDPSGGRATAAAIPGAELWTIPGMGHDLPPELFDQVADRVAALAGNPDVLTTFRRHQGGVR